MTSYYSCDYKDCEDMQRLPVKAGEEVFEDIVINHITLHICPEHMKVFAAKGLVPKPYIYDDAQKLMEFLLEIIDERIEVNQR